jgi:Amt family ammonium transporter
MSHLRRLFVGLMLCCSLTMLSSAVMAQPDPATPATPAVAAPTTPPATAPAAPDAAAAPAAAPSPKSPDFAANNAWMLTSSALVLFMTVPGLAMFYSGLVRKKNVLSVIMQCMFLQGIMGVIWFLYGYSFCFGGDPLADGAPKWSMYVGNGDYVMLDKTFPKWEKGATAVTASEEFKDPAGTVYMPIMTHVLFQGMFFIITPALICGAYAERMKFSAMVVFSVLWGTCIYMPLCHMVWDCGFLAYGGKNSLAGGALDFAGGTVVHISSGVSALIAAILIGKRIGYGVKPMPPHNLTYTALGAGMLWVGWFGFNAGSELMSDEVATTAFAATHFSAAAATIAWAGMEWLTRGKPSMLGAASGAVAGLVCITPASGFVSPGSAILMGLAAGVVCFFACTTIKNKFGYDDSLDVFGVHGVGGTLGALLTGVFATRGINNWGTFVEPLYKNNLTDKPLGIVDGGYDLIVGQAAAVGFTWVLAIVGSFIILKLIDFTIGLRVTEQEEQEGLDITQHGEEGYIFN